MRSDISAVIQLLHVVTACGRISWSEWKEACASVSAGDTGGLSPSDFLRPLEMLGHVEIGPINDQVHVCAAPSILARLPLPGLPEAVLCGGRSPRTEGHLRALAQSRGVTMTVHVPDGRQIPSVPVIRFSADDPGALADLASDAAIGYAQVPPAWALLHAAGTVEKYLEGLNWAHCDEPDIEAAEFDPATGRFIRTAPSTRMRLIRYRPRRFRPYYELRDGGRSVVVDRDWGAWVCARALGAAYLVYDPDSHAVAVPAAVGLPRPLARGLALCSGLPPTLVPAAECNWPTGYRGDYHVFTKIPGNIAGLVALHAGQQMVYCRIGPASAHE